MPEEAVGTFQLKKVSLDTAVAPRVLAWSFVHLCDSRDGLPLRVC